jgi:AraC-like DNA-binding protein
MEISGEFGSRLDAIQHSGALSHLCAAARVSQGTLYHAFMVMCDASPMEYFKKRRLTDARMALLGCVPQRGSIKQAAPGAGLTHLGRFAA